MTQNDVIDAIKAERERQDELHPVVAKYLIPPYHDDGNMRFLADSYKRNNDKMEKIGEASWYDVFREELHEIFAETDPVKIREEAIQLAALCVRLCENI